MRRGVVWGALGLTGLIIPVVVAGPVLVHDTPPGDPDTVLVLAGDDAAGSRLATGIRVARETGARPLIVSLVDPAWVWDPRPRIREQVADGGIALSDLRFIGPSDSTADEAGMLATLVERCGWEEVAVVTSPYHTRRAGWLVGRALPEGVEVTPIAADETVHPWTWWAHAADAKEVLREWVKVASSSRFLFDLPEARPTDVTC
jgi:uncharacterized SAM-binding protein YcdF (DUF218 family)